MKLKTFVTGLVLLTLVLNVEARVRGTPSIPVGGTNCWNLNSCENVLYVNNITWIPQADEPELNVNSTVFWDGIDEISDIPGSLIDNDLGWINESSNGTVATVSDPNLVLIYGDLALNDTIFLDDSLTVGNTSSNYVASYIDADASGFAFNTDGASSVAYLIKRDSAHASPNDLGIFNVGGNITLWSSDGRILSNSNLNILSSSSLTLGDNEEIEIFKNSNDLDVDAQRINLVYDDVSKVSLDSNVGTPTLGLLTENGANPFYMIKYNSSQTPSAFTSAVWLYNPDGNILLQSGGELISYQDTRLIGGDVLFGASTSANISEDLGDIYYSGDNQNNNYGVLLSDADWSGIQLVTDGGTGSGYLIKLDSAHASYPDKLRLLNVGGDIDFWTSGGEIVAYSSYRQSLGSIYVGAGASDRIWRTTDGVVIQSQDKIYLNDAKEVRVLNDLRIRNNKPINFGDSLNESQIYSSSGTLTVESDGDLILNPSAGIHQLSLRDGVAYMTLETNAGADLKINTSGNFEIYPSTAGNNPGGVYGLNVQVGNNHPYFIPQNAGGVRFAGNPGDDYVEITNNEVYSNTSLTLSSGTDTIFIEDVINLNPLTLAPTTQAGSIYYDDSGAFCGSNSTHWIKLGGEGSCV